MEIVTTLAGLRSHSGAWCTQGRRVAFVPTMGNLHAGHLKLVRHARAIADHVVVSSFVNPMQFGQDEDYASYPITLEQDIAALMDVDADLLFAPGVSEMYAGEFGQTTQVVVPGLNALLEGEFRPTHFNGVSTVVAKLFNMVQPDIAVFGEKDFQQLLIIRRMVSDLNMPIAIEAVETVREADGLAMSSRNRYLSARERAIAPQLHQTLLDVRDIVLRGEHDLAAIEQAAMEQLRDAGFGPQYLCVRRCADLGVPESEHDERVVLAAAMLGVTRLIDNVRVSVT
ncbi:MAG: pantoate--beta-alanine ligase [Pseudomonadota bacterium]